MPRRSRFEPWNRYARFAVGWGWTLVMASLSLVATLVLGRRGGDFAWLTVRPRWAKVGLRLARCVLRPEGTEHLATPAIFAVNHESFIDIVTMPALLPARVKFVAKHALRHVPLWGWAFARTGGAVFIDRADRRQAVTAMRAAVEALPAGWSVCIFPEGTRSRDGQLGPLKAGMVYLAMQTKLPVVPIGCSGARDSMDYGVLVPHPATVFITIGEPIATDAWRAATVKEHLQEVHAALQRCVAASRARRAAQPEENR